MSSVISTTYTLVILAIYYWGAPNSIHTTTYRYSTIHTRWCYRYHLSTTSYISYLSWFILCSRSLPLHHLLMMLYCMVVIHGLSATLMFTIVGYLGIYATRYYVYYLYSPPSIIHYTTYVYMSSGGGYYSCSTLTIIHYTTYVYMSCEGYTNTSTVLDATIGIQTIGVYL